MKILVLQQTIIFLACRSTDMPYEKNVNYTVVLDGFIVSKNVDVIMVENVDTNFEYSDHNPGIYEICFKIVFIIKGIKFLKITNNINNLRRLI